MPQGTIKKLIADKGFGFLEGERGDLFFHHSAVEGTAIKALRVGQAVTYEEGRRTKRPSALKRLSRLNHRSRHAKLGAAEQTSAPTQKYLPLLKQSLKLKDSL